jgi:uncharacterized repeat protein (TIGR01451 family)
MEVDASRPQMFFRLKREIASGARFPINAVAAGNGTLQPAGTTLASVNQGLTFSAAPDQGYNVGAWYLDGQVAQMGGTNFSLAGVDDEHTVIATFLPINDLQVSMSAQLPVIQTNAVAVGTNVTLLVTVANRGLNPATGVMVGDYLPQELAVVSASFSQGKASQYGTNLVWAVGNLSRYASATATITCVPLAPGALATTVWAMGRESEADLSNNQVTSTVYAH